MTYAPRHRKAESTLASSVVSSLAGRHGKALTGVALAVPTTLASVGMADAANAAALPAAPAPQVASAAVTATTQAAATTATAASVTAAVPQHWSGGVYVLHYGHTGAHVRTLQSRLKISADGSFGPQTLRTVKAFQSRKGLSVDGFVGPATWRALGGFPGRATTTTTKAASRSTPVSSSSSSNARAAQIAHRYLGIPYVYGGSTTRGFDCSGLTSYVFRQVGKSLPRSARAQQAAVRRVSSPQVGDLVFYGYPAYHVGIYVGDGKVLNAPKPGTRVRVNDIYRPALSGYGRP